MDMDTGGADGGCPPAQAGETHVHQPFVRSRRYRAARTACPRCGGAKRRLVATAAAREAAGLGGCFGARCTGPTSRRRRPRYRALGATATRLTHLTSSPTSSRQRPAPPHRPSLVRRPSTTFDPLPNDALLTLLTPRPTFWTVVVAEESRRRPLASSPCRCVCCCPPLRVVPVRYGTDPAWRPHQHQAVDVT
jgi:hypothetical protein